MSKDENLRFIYSPDSKKAVIDVAPAPLEISKEPIPGFYKVREISGFFGSSFTFTKFEVELPNTAAKTSELIMDTKEIDSLFSEESLRIHTALGIPAKIGYILHGVQGTGKSTAMYAVAETLIAAYGATILEVSDATELEAAYTHIKNLRLLKPNTMAVVLMDECEDQMRGNESEMKLLLDSKDTPSNFVFIGATNYIDKIPDSIKKRPSRIKQLFNCSRLNEEEDIVFGILQNMNSSLSKTDQLSDKEIKELTPSAVSKTIDEIKHLFTGAAIAIAMKTPKVKTKKKSDSTVLAEELS